MIDFITKRLADKTSIASYASTLVYILSLGGITGIEVDWVTGALWGIANIGLFIYHKVQK